MWYSQIKNAARRICIELHWIECWTQSKSKRKSQMHLWLLLSFVMATSQLTAREQLNKCRFNFSDILFAHNVIFRQSWAHDERLYTSKMFTPHNGLKKGLMRKTRSAFSSCLCCYTVLFIPNRMVTVVGYLVCVLTQSDWAIDLEELLLNVAGPKYTEPNWVKVVPCRLPHSLQFPV